MKSPKLTDADDSILETLCNLWEWSEDETEEDIQDENDYD